ncbi:extracellular solute-binding protein [Propionicimonas sp.]|uniref:extracellular solute-binding protein n=1 Tax=Propionicimonas sp. TaxID=1955623 RepID=UPI00180D7F95|nr:extracellular solute-binding protein [Propionicimonas sp.]MBU3977150.1 extracellular solute-binding protein [Actinomycetota bacterium]MBA3020717.1 extracellular solute-binding protein [Propionicimonas sp.]MBU3985090.1 extracellular solute-binding protein [Actinomycetota bacterium]MBU4006953.1 extracellular solute-binding protein [Actinomycetota bacterium]MBU4064706.1 extracellular solute-binding protein [Actinomycetota bacterium]
MRAERLVVGRGIRWGLAAGLALAFGLSATACVPAPQPVPTDTASISSERGPIVLAIPDDSAATWTHLVRVWNEAHPSEPITLRVLSADETRRHNELVAAGEAKSGEFSLLAVDRAWIPQFAEAGWLAELPAAEFPTDGLQAAAVSAGTYGGALYAYPLTADAGVLYYRKDLLAAAKVKPPTTWAELASACDKVLAQTRGGPGCYGQGLQSSESLTIAVAEAIDSAGGELVTEAGVPGLDTPAATTGVEWLAEAVQDGSIDSDALGWDDDEAARAFVAGDLVFVRGWSRTWNLAQQGDGSSKVYGRVGVAALVGPTGAAVPTAGGLSLGLATHARNQATAADVMRWLASDPIQREALTRGALAPVRDSLYTDQGLLKEQPQLTTVAAAIKVARPLPVTTHYAEFSTTLSEVLYPVVQGSAQASKTLPGLQTRLAELLK